MTDPIRYLDREHDDVASTLLRSAHSDGPSFDSVQRALRVAAGAAVATTVTTTASGALWLKWLGIGLLAGGVTAGGASALLARSGGSEADGATHRLRAASTTGVFAEERFRVAPPEQIEAKPEPTLEPNEASSVRAPSAPGPSTPPAASAVAARADTLARELARIDSARRSLASGNASGAIAELDRYRDEFRRPRFGEEAALIRAEALATLGNCSGARAVADSVGGGQGKSVLDRRWKALRERCR